MENGLANYRKLGCKDSFSVGIDDFVKMIKDEIRAI